MTIRDGLNQDVTWWAATPDSYGGYTFAAPVVLRGRWQDSAELFRTAQGEEVSSRAVVYLSADVSEGDYIWLGSSAVTDPTTLSNPSAEQVRRFMKSPDLRLVTYIRKAMI